MSKRFAVGPCRCASVLAVLALGACAPNTAVRRTTLIPAAALPARVGAPLAAGHGRAGFEVDSVDLYDVGAGPLLTPRVGDPGVLVPEVQLGGMLYYGLSTTFEIGAQLSYTRASWAEQNAAGVLPFPDGTTDSLWSGGAGARLHLFREDDAEGRAKYSVGVVGELNLTDVPEVVFVRTTTASGMDTYELYEERSEVFLMPNVAIAGGLAVGDKIFLEALLGAQTSITNVGFDEMQNIDQDTTDDFWLGYLGAGVDFQLSMFFANLHLFFPIEDQDRIDFGVMRGQLQTGLAF